MAKLSDIWQGAKNIGQDVLTLGSIPANYAAGITGLPIGYTTEPMRNRLDDLARSKGSTNFTVGYPDFGMRATKQPEISFDTEGRIENIKSTVNPAHFSGIIPRLGIPPSITDLALGLTLGDVSGKKDKFGNIKYDPATTAYDFMQKDPTKQTETDSWFTDLINRGGIFGNRWHVPVNKVSRFKQQQLMNQRKQDMQRQIREAEAAAAAKAEAEKKRIEQEKIKTAQKNWKPTYNPASSHAEAQATGGDYHSGHESTVDGQTTDWGPSSHMIARGGLAQHAPRYANGGLIDFFRYGGFIG